MKILKVKINRNRSGGKTSYTYPPQYNPLQFTVITYETMLTGKFDEVVGRGDTDEYVIGFVQDAHAPAFLQSADIVEITRAEADAFCGADIDKSVTKITDPDRVLAIVAKAALDEKLTTDEKKALDPNDPTAGIGRSRTLREAMDAYGL